MIKCVRMVGDADALERRGIKHVFIQQELRPATVKLTTSHKEEETLPIDKIGKDKMIDSYMNNRLAIATAERTSNYCLSLVPRRKSLVVQKYIERTVRRLSLI